MIGSFPLKLGIFSELGPKSSKVEQTLPRYFYSGYYHMKKFNFFFHRRLTSPV